MTETNPGSGSRYPDTATREYRHFPTPLHGLAISMIGKTELGQELSEVSSMSYRRDGSGKSNQVQTLVHALTYYVSYLAWDLHFHCHFHFQNEKVLLFVTCYEAVTHHFMTINVDSGLMEVHIT